jgi:hypothetical protein
MLVYMKNVSTDSDLRSIDGSVVTFPIAWWWERMAEYGGKSIWLGWSLASGFVLYFLVSVMEFISFIIYETGSLGVALWYYRTIGFWGSGVAYVIPFIFAIIQVWVEGITAFPGSWSVLLLCFFGVQWIVYGLVHIYFIGDFIAHVEAQEATDCVCSIPEV